MLSPKANRKKKLKKMTWILAVLVVLLALAGLTAHRQGITVPEQILQIVVAPVQGVFQHFTTTVFGFVATAKNYQLLMSENEQLRTRVAEAVTLEARVTELRRENNRLRKMLGMREGSEYDLIAAEVIARDPSSWFKTVTINKGTRHGIIQHRAVVTVDGLIGYVSSVSLTTANVQLLTDSGRGVSALVQRSREPGNIIGSVEYDPDKPGFLRMINLPRDANILRGDTIISSGLGGFFPKSLVIGYVMETTVDDLGLTGIATVQPAANFNRLEEVFVVIPAEEQDAEDLEEGETS